MSYSVYLFISSENNSHSNTQRSQWRNFYKSAMKKSSNNKSFLRSHLVRYKCTTLIQNQNNLKKQRTLSHWPETKQLPDLSLFFSDSTPFLVNKKWVNSCAFKTPPFLKEFGNQKIAKKSPEMLYPIRRATNVTFSRSRRWRRLIRGQIFWDVVCFTYNGSATIEFVHAGDNFFLEFSLNQVSHSSSKGEDTQLDINDGGVA